MPLDPEDDAWMNDDLRWAERARTAEARVVELEIERDYFKQKSSDWHGGLQEAMERISKLKALTPYLIHQDRCRQKCNCGLNELTKAADIGSCLSVQPD